MIIWDFGWLNPHHACKTQSDELCPTCPSFPVAKAGRMSVLSAHSCHKSLHAWHAQCTGSSGQQIVWLVGSGGIRQIHGVLLGTDSLIWDPYQDWVFLPSSACRPHLSASNVPTSVQKHESASNMASDRETLTGWVPPSRCSATVCWCHWMCSPAATLPLSVYPWWGAVLTELMLIIMDWDSAASGCLISSDVKHRFHQGDQSRQCCKIFLPAILSCCLND